MIQCSHLEAHPTHPCGTVFRQVSSVRAACALFWEPASNGILAVSEHARRMPGGAL